ASASCGCRLRSLVCSESDALTSCSRLLTPGTVFEVAFMRPTNAEGWPIMATTMRLGFWAAPASLPDRGAELPGPADEQPIANAVAQTRSAIDRRDLLIRPSVRSRGHSEPAGEESVTTR